MDLFRCLLLRKIYGDTLEKLGMRLQSFPVVCKLIQLEAVGKKHVRSAGADILLGEPKP